MIYNTLKKYQKLITAIDKGKTTVRFETLEQAYTMAILEPLNMPTHALKAISHAIRFSLDFGGDSVTAKKLDVIAQELASEGWIRECETTGDIEDELLRIYNENQKIKEYKQKGLDFINNLYQKLFLDKKPKINKNQLVLRPVYDFIIVEPLKDIKTPTNVNKRPFVYSRVDNIILAPKTKTIIELPKESKPTKQTKSDTKPKDLKFYIKTNDTLIFNNLVFKYTKPAQELPKLENVLDPNWLFLKLTKDKLNLEYLKSKRPKENLFK